MSVDSATKAPPGGARRMNAAEYFRMPPGPPYSQLIDGELIMSPSANFQHQQILIRLLVRMEPHIRKHRLGQVMIAPSDVQLDPANVFQPDLYFIRTERLGIIDEQGPKGPPDLVAEIVSQGSRRQDLGPKKITYAARGVIEYWAILPRTREVQVFLLQEESEKPARILTVNDVLESSLLPGLEIPLTEMFED